MINETVKFSIIIPAYKRKFLRECIDSIIAQTYANFELIIVDDASPEDLYSIVSKYCDNRIQYYRNANNCGGINVVDNWNICLGYCTGKYVICMGDDDKLLPNCLQVYYDMILKHPGFGIYHGWTELIDENSHIVKIQEARPEVECVYSMMWHRWNGRVQYIGDFLFEVALLRKNKGFYKNPLGWASDDISACIAAKYKGVVNSQIPIFQYRINSQTISKTGNCLLKIEAVERKKKWYHVFLAQNIPNPNTTSFIFWSMLKKECNSKMDKKKALYLSVDMKKDFFMIFFYYLFHMKKCNINTKIFLYAIILLLINAFLKHY